MGLGSVCSAHHPPPVAQPLIFSQTQSCSHSPCLLASWLPLPTVLADRTLSLRGPQLPRSSEASLSIRLPPLFYVNCSYQGLHCTPVCTESSTGPDLKWDLKCFVNKSLKYKPHCAMTPKGSFLIIAYFSTKRIFNLKN